MSRRRKSKPRGRAMTLPEFKAWLRGIGEFQGEDWIPTAEQWALIMANISAIKEGECEKCKEREARGADVMRNQRAASPAPRPQAPSAPAPLPPGSTSNPPPRSSLTSPTNAQPQQSLPPQSPVVGSGGNKEHKVGEFN